MTFDTTPKPGSLRDGTVIEQTPLPQSRELGGSVLDSRQDGPKVTQRSSPFAKSWAHFIAGAAGGTISTTVTAPLDVLKTRLQSDFYKQQLVSTRAARGIPPIETMSLARSSLLHIRETFQILFAVPRTEGWRALFKGLGPNLVGVVPARAINFYVYGNSKNILSSQFNNGKEAAWIHMCSAIAAGITTGTATNPIWMVKTRLQLDKNNSNAGGGRQYRNAFDCVKQVIQKEGVKGLYRGLTASYVGVSESTAQWLLYEQGKKYLRNREERLQASGRARTAWDDTVAWSGQIVAAGGAKFFAALATYPHEVVRTRLRLGPMANGQLKYTGLVQCFKLVLKEEGMVGLYGGLVPHMLRVVPSAAIMFGTYEAVLKLLGSTSQV